MLIVRLYQDVPADQKPAGIPDEWPAEVQVVDDGTAAPSGFVAMTEAELATYTASKQSLYLAWRDAQDLPGAKEAKFASIDTKTTALIGDGFSFAGKVFSLSLSAQSTYGGLYMIREEPSLSFPVNVNTIDDLDVHPLANSEEIRSFYLSAVATYRAHLDDGTALKDLVRSALTTAEVAAVMDNR